MLSYLMIKYYVYIKPVTTYSLLAIFNLDCPNSIFRIAVLSRRRVGENVLTPLLNFIFCEENPKY